MNQSGFESAVLQMWMTTRIPMTRANLQYYTKAPRKKLERWLDAMVGEGVLEVDADDDGEMIWAVRGAARSTVGPTTIGEVAKIDSLRADLGHAGSALALASRAVSLTHGRAAGREQKSIIASGALSFFFGPLGWLYAAPLKEAVPAIVLYALLWWLPLVHFLLLPLLPVLHIASGVVGAAYAWKYNQRGERTALGEEVKRLPSRRT